MRESTPFTLVVSDAPCPAVLRRCSGGLSCDWGRGRRADPTWPGRSRHTYHLTRAPVPLSDSLRLPAFVSPLSPISSGTLSLFTMYDPITALCLPPTLTPSPRCYRKPCSPSAIAITRAFSGSMPSWQRCSVTFSTPSQIPPPLLLLFLTTLNHTHPPHLADPSPFLIVLRHLNSHRAPAFFACPAPTAPAPAPAPAPPPAPHPPPPATCT